MSGAHFRHYKNYGFRNLAFLFAVYFCALPFLGVVLSVAPTTTIAADNSITVEITTHLGDAQTFKQGDVISFFLSLDKDAHVLVLHLDATGNLQQLLPNALQQNSFYKSGLFIPIPNERNPFQFKVGPPFGKETLWVFASDKTLPSIITTKSANGSLLINQDIAEIKSLLRHQATNNAYEYGEAQLILNTVAASTPAPQ
ncbi:DUF4384 domain-containing protein [Kaarinaea lacus]